MEICNTLEPRDESCRLAAISLGPANASPDILMKAEGVAMREYGIEDREKNTSVKYLS
jgi:hypothetical protein